MPVFITGGNGYIGAKVIAELRKRTHVVRALVRSEAAAAKVRALGAEPVHGDMRDLDVLRREAESADAVIHTAQEMTAENAEVTRRAVGVLLDATRDERAFVYTSGAWVYGSRGDAIVGEDAPLNPLILVAWRPAVEALVLETARLRGIVIRPGIVYGDDGGMVGSLMDAARSGPVQVVGDGGNRWPMVRHDALAELFGLVVDNRTARGVYNAQRGAAVPYVEIARAASRAAGGDGAVVHLGLDDARKTMGPFADALACDLQMSSARAERELGWNPHRPTVLEELSNTTVV